jgi:co-chaperonin GroES (HSP10)
MSTKLPEGTNKLINKYLIKVDGLFKKKYLNGKEIYMDNSYNELQNAQSVGEVVALPMKKSLQDPNINVGDSVLLHHFATAKNKVIKIGNDKEVYVATEASMMYMAIDKNNSCKAVGPFCILEKEEEKEIHTESGIFTGEVEEKDNNEGVVVAADESFINHGGSLGDTVVFDKGVDYDMQIPDGKMYYRVRTSSIYAIVNG